MPTLATALRATPLPSDTIVLIRIAAGCDETTAEAADLTDLPPGTVREAAIFYLGKVLFARDSDCYRVLGVPPGASRHQMREHMIWLMRWLSPRPSREEWERAFATRVLRAWRESRFPKPMPVPRIPEKAPPEAPSLRRPRRHQTAAVRPARKKRRSTRLGIAAAIFAGAVGLAVSSATTVDPISRWIDLHIAYSKGHAED